MLKDVSSTVGSSASLYKHSAVKPSMFDLCDDDSLVFSNISANTPDDIVVNANSREVFIWAVPLTIAYRKPL